MKLKVFTQENCAPCRKLKPKIKELDVETEFIDIEESLGKARDNRVASTPTTLIIDENGEEKQRILGNRDKEDIQKHLE